MSWWELALLVLAIIAIILMATRQWMRSLPWIGNSRDQQRLDEIREQLRGKPFDRTTTIQKDWQE